MTGSCSVPQAARVYSLIRPVEDSFSTDLLCVDVGHREADTVAFVVGNVSGSFLPGTGLARSESGQGFSL